MYQSPERGVLLLSSGKQIDNKTLSKICGVEEQTINKLLIELEGNGVLSRLENQAIYNRRMYRDGQISKARSMAGSWEREKQKLNKKETKVKQNAEYEDEYIKESIKEGDCKGEEEKIQKKQQEELFTAFWNLYPKRGNKKVGKKECQDFTMQKIQPEEWESLLKATKNYAESDECKNGYARDPIRFLKKEYWRDWIDVKGIGQRILQKSLPKFDEDKEFLCAECGTVKPKTEREYDKAGRQVCKKCDAVLNMSSQDWWAKLTPEARAEQIAIRKKLRLPLQPWMQEENESDKN